MECEASGVKVFNRLRPESAAPCQPGAQRSDAPGSDPNWFQALKRRHSREERAALSGLVFLWLQRPNAALHGCAVWADRGLPFQGEEPPYLALRLGAAGWPSVGELWGLPLCGSTGGSCR